MLTFSSFVYFEVTIVSNVMFHNISLYMVNMYMYKYNASVSYLCTVHNWLYISLASNY